MFKRKWKTLPIGYELEMVHQDESGHTVYGLFFYSTLVGAESNKFYSHKKCVRLLKKQAYHFNKESSMKKAAPASAKS